MGAGFADADRRGTWAIYEAMIFSDVPDPRLVTIRRGGTLTDADHHLLAVWAADCAEHVLHYFEQARPGDDRPRRAVELARACLSKPVDLCRFLECLETIA